LIFFPFSPIEISREGCPFPFIVRFSPRYDLIFLLFPPILRLGPLRTPLFLFPLSEGFPPFPSHASRFSHRKKFFFLQEISFLTSNSLFWSLLRQDFELPFFFPCEGFLLLRAKNTTNKCVFSFPPLFPFLPRRSAYMSKTQELSRRWPQNDPAGGSSSSLYR